jgi:hypothetical protein
MESFLEVDLDLAFQLSEQNRYDFETFGGPLFSFCVNRR